MQTKRRTRAAILDELRYCQECLSEMEKLESERRPAEGALRESEKKYRELVETANSIIVRMDTHGKFIFFNKFAQQFFGFTEDEILGRNAVGTIVPETGSDGRDLVSMMKDVCKNPGNYIRHENENICKNGERVWVEWNNKSIMDDQGKPREILGIGCDVTQRKRSEEKLLIYQKRLRSLASRLALTEERERRSIALHLHDTVGQILAICKVKIEELREAAAGATFAPALDEIKAFVEQVIRETRTLTLDLSPPSLYEVGLEAGIEWLLQQMGERHGILSELERGNGILLLDEDIRIVLFQAVRELLINVVKHSQSKMVRISIRKRCDLIEIKVKDFGVGFDLGNKYGSAGKTRGFGLFSVRERLTYLGGQVAIDSQPGLGTEVTLIAPAKAKRS